MDINGALLATPSRWMRLGAESGSLTCGLTREPTVVYDTGFGLSDTGSGDSERETDGRLGSQSKESKASSRETDVVSSVSNDEVRWAILLSMAELRVS